MKIKGGTRKMKKQQRGVKVRKGQGKKTSKARTRSFGRAKKVEGGYLINGKVYPKIKGTKAEVWNGNAHRTSGGVTKDGLIHTGERIKFAAMSKAAGKNNNLGKHLQKKGSGIFGPQ